MALLLLFGLTACGGPGNEPESESVPKGDGQITSEPAPSSREPAVSITETAARTVDLELYETPDFSIQIPKGWTVTSGGTGMYHSIRIQDPAEPLNQMFVLLKGLLPPKIPVCLQLQFLQQQVQRQRLPLTT